MLCASCNIEISSLFKYAMAQNICPACGNKIMNENMLVLINNIKETILNEAKLHEDIVHGISVALLLKYDISLRDSSQVRKSQHTGELKVAPPSMIQKISKSNIIKAEEIPSDGISEEEREKIMEEVVRKRYAVVDQIQDSNSDEFNQDEQQEFNTLFTEGGVNPVLERDRLARLAKQKNALTGGGVGAFRRSS